MARQGKIPALKVGKSWRFKVTQIKAILNIGSGL